MIVVNTKNIYILFAHENIYYQENIKDDSPAEFEDYHYSWEHQFF